MSDFKTYHLGEYTCRVTFCTPAEALQVPAQKKALYISDSNVLPQLQAIVGQPLPVVAFKAGEEAKIWSNIELALMRGFDLGLGRDDCMVGVGGGVVCDMTAFAASLYMRGCTLVLAPTTLLAMVDAAFGGKTGINFGGYKNMVGTFYPSSELRIAPGFLSTLPEREFRSGLGEVIKHAMLDDPELWTFLHDSARSIQSRDMAAMEYMVRRSFDVKGRVVEADLREENIRAHLNLGHTFAHALEAVAGFGLWSHGEAVAWGLHAAVRLSHRLGLCPKSWVSEVEQLLQLHGYRTQSGENPAALLHAMKQDKKKKAGQVRFVLQEGPCKTLLRTVAEEDVLAVLD